MKKAYKKPVVIIENLALNTNVAAGCDHKISSHTQGSCGIEFGADYLFVSGVSACTFPVEDGNNEYDSRCYHTPIETNDLFNS